MAGTGAGKAEKIIRVLTGVLILGSILAALKTILVDYTLDEEYQVVMAYRRLSGDTLFGTMWEPHQTSAFLCVWLMWLYRTVTGTLTGVVLFLRLCTTGIQLAFTIWIYRVLRRVTGREYALILALTWFNISPKLIMVPDFSNLQVWGLTAAVLALARMRMRKDGGGIMGGRLRTRDVGERAGVSVRCDPFSGLVDFALLLCRRRNAAAAHPAMCGLHRYVCSLWCAVAGGCPAQCDVG